MSGEKDFQQAIEPGMHAAATDRVACLFPIVGIGASAGGLGAYQRLLKGLPADTGMAFVLIQHLHPDFPSQLAEILSRSTPMPVIEVHDEPEIQPNHVYVIPPARSMVIERTSLGLHPRSAVRGLHRPVDEFFRSLAEFHGNCGIGVLLSGTGSDGVEGMEEIKSEGGITFAQDDSAQYDGMPSSAIAAGCVDFVMAPEAIAAELVRIARHPYVTTRTQAHDRQDIRAISRILQHVHEETGVDFTNYKSTTLQRRLTRRMLLRGQDNAEQYLRYLRANPREVQELYRDFLINVTRFFRDPESFDALAMHAFAEIFAGRNPERPVRVWTLGCASGEEAYSIAIGLHEYATRERLATPIQVFATDLSDSDIESARAALYSHDIENHVTPERLKRYFDKTENGYQIGKLIRDMCVFARQNVLSDPPFSRMDLITCRNLLIYMEPVLQQRVLPLFHYALNPGGFLWLGSAETIGGFDDLFETRDARHRVYRSLPGRGVPPRLASLARVPSARSPVPAPSRPFVAGGRKPIHDADRFLLAHYAPAAALVTGDGTVVQFRGDTSPFLAVGSDKPSLNVYKMARDGLLLPLRETVQRARHADRQVSGTGSCFDGGSLRSVAIEVVPIHSDAPAEVHYLIVFRPITPAPGAVSSTDRTEAPAETGSDQADLDEVAQWRAEHARMVQELHAAHDYLQAMLEQRDTSTEELQFANEEAQSSNEELQSINEELQTTKEEMESANEELRSVNDELTDRAEQLRKANDDMNNVIASTEIALVTVDRDLFIRRFTPAAKSLLNLISSDIGRPLNDLKLSLGMEDIETALRDVLRDIPVPEREVKDRNGRWHSMRLRPYRIADGSVDGAVVVLVDVEQQKQNEASIRDSQRKFKLLMEGGVGIAIVFLDAEGRFTGWNSGATRMFQYDQAEIIGQPLSLLYREEEAGQATDDINAAARSEYSKKDLPMRRRDGSSLWASSVLTALRDADNRIQGYSSVISDISSQRHSEEVRLLAEQRKDEFLSILAHELRNPLAPISSSVHLLQSPALSATDARRVLAVMKRQVAHMVRLIDDLLDVARIAKGKIEFRPAPLELASVIETAVQSATPAMIAASHELAIRMPPKPILLYADHARLAQAIANLLLNAARYTPDGGHVELSASIVGMQCVIGVKDDGIGIEPDKQREVFELFAQADHLPGRSRDGLGIGLSLVRALAELHGGHVEVESAGTGKGSTFRLIVPHSSPPKQREPARDQNVALAAGQRILIVDDNRDAADSIAVVLRLQGHEVSVVYDAESGFDVAAAERPDFALLDLGLPRMNGQELCQKIRATEWGRDMVLVALTGWGQEHDTQSSMDAGFDAHLVKPTDPERLPYTLQHVRMQREKPDGP